jgi:hypothetical protein
VAFHPLSPPPRGLSLLRQIERTSMLTEGEAAQEDF